MPAASHNRSGITLQLAGYLRGTATLSAICAGAALAPCANAQSVADDRLSLNFELQLRHESNIANTSAQAAEARGLKRADQIASPGLTLDLQKQLGRHMVSAGARAGYNFHANNSQLDREQLSLDSMALLDFRYCEVTPSISYSRQLSDLGNLVSLDDPTLVADNTQSVQDYAVNVSCGGVVGLRPQAGISYSRGDNSNPLRQRADFETVEYTAGLGYRQPSIGDLSLFYSKQKTEFRNRTLNGVRDSFEAQRFGASISRDIGARLAANARIYFLKSSASTAVGRDFEGVGYSAGITYRISSQLQAQLNLGRDVQNSLNNDALYTLDETYGANLAYVLNPRLSFDAGYTLRKRDYTYSTFLGELPVDLLSNETFHAANLGANYTYSERLRFTLFGGYESRSANGTAFDYDGYFVGLTTSLAILR